MAASSWRTSARRPSLSESARARASTPPSACTPPTRMRRPASTVVEFPFYGDELERLVQLTNTPLGIDATAKGTQTDAEKELRGEILEDMVAALGITRADIEREYAGQPLQKGPENWEWVQAILRAVDRVPGLNSSAIDLFTR